MNLVGVREVLGGSDVRRGSEEGTNGCGVTCTDIASGSTLDAQLVKYC